MTLDGPSPPRDAAQGGGALLWGRARTFEALCDLAARFVEGEIDCFPGWGWPTLDLESAAIAPDLAALNRAGFLTLASQPGRIERDASGVVRRQRAFVFGFVSDEVAARLAASALVADLEVRVFLPGTTRDPATSTATPVGEREAEPDAFAGYPAFEPELALFAQLCGSEALAELARAPFVSAIDMVWGRERELWNELARTLARDGAGVDAEMLGCP